MNHTRHERRRFARSGIGHKPTFRLARFCVPALMLLAVLLGSMIGPEPALAIPGLSMAALNLLLNPMPVFNYQAAQDSEDLTTGVNLLELRLRITGTVDIAGGTTNGTLQTDPVERLIRSLWIIRDGEEIVERISGRALRTLTRRSYPQVPDATAPANAGVQTTAFRSDLVIPLSPKWLARPHDMFVAAQRIRQQFAVYVEWETGRTTAASDQGSQAFVNGGDRTVTFTVGPSLQITEVYSVDPVKPLYEPRIAVGVTEQFSAANARLPLELRESHKIAMHILRTMEGAQNNYADLINEITFRAGATRFFSAVAFDDFKTMERNLFPAVPAAGEAGVVTLFYADGGKLGNAVDARQMMQPVLEFDVDAPGTNPGQIEVISFGAKAVPGITQAQS